MLSVTVPCKLAETYVCACHTKQTCITMRGRTCTTKRVLHAVLWQRRWCKSICARALSAGNLQQARKLCLQHSAAQALLCNVEHCII